MQDLNRRAFSKIIGLSGLSAFLPGISPFLPDKKFTKSDFGPDFKWGVATAAAQIEGAWDVDGKSPSVWDVFSRKKGGKKIKHRDTPSVSCDFYNRYEGDLDLLKQMNFDVFRFSTAWSRLLPEGIGRVNEKGFDFYDRVVDACLERSIEPWVTLYHWDIPQILQDKGGWANRDVVSWFEEYADKVTRRLGDRVKNWMVLNEPTAFTALGYLAGIHAPGKISAKKFLKSVHHTTLVQALGGKIIRDNVSDANIGTTISCSSMYSKNDKRRHVAAMKRMDVLLNRLYIEPALGMGYPSEDWRFLRKIRRYMEEGDEDKLAFDFDFIGLQNYTRANVKHVLLPYIWAIARAPEKYGVPELRITEMNWEVYPEGIYEVLKTFSQYKNMPPIIVTENGCAFEDKVFEDGHVHDVKRKAFYQEYIRQVLRAKQEGVDVRGYFAWTLMDNFEWAEGYEPRFGLIHVDFDTQQRIIKDSGLWFKDFLAGND